MRVERCVSRHPAIRAREESGSFDRSTRRHRNEPVAALGEAPWSSRPGARIVDVDTSRASDWPAMAIAQEQIGTAEIESVMNPVQAERLAELARSIGERPRAWRELAAFGHQVDAFHRFDRP